MEMSILTRIWFVLKQETEIKYLVSIEVCIPYDSMEFWKDIICQQ